MKRNILLFTFCALFALAGSAQKRKGTVKPVPVPVSRIQPVPADTFSYAMGIVQAPSLRQYLVQQEGVDTAALSFAAQGIVANLSEEEANRIIALAAGLKIARVNRDRVIPSINQQATGREDSVYMDTAIYCGALAAALMGEQMAYTADSAQKVVERQMEYQQNQFRVANETWLEKNKAEKGVVTLPSGLQYRILTAGTGPKPAEGAKVEVNYEGRLIDGTVFDSSYKRGKSTTFPVNGVIKGWTEALMLMPEGSTWELYIPQELGYGDKGAGRDIPAYATLIFKVELIKADAK
ncbi:MAG: FKBP-type peptidyl-prolyl cis-trans isomerase [Alloprevotella sp.]|nr:FKBP-type peptidyl-prolyl cis-trans isomerase [Alloprevotella sp.]